MGSLVASSSQAVLLPLGRATVAGPGGMGGMGRREGVGRREGGSSVRGERGVRMAKLEVESNIDMATGGGEVQGGISAHAPHCDKLLQGSCEEVHTCS